MAQTRRATWVMREWQVRAAMAEAHFRTVQEASNRAGMVPQHWSQMLRGIPVMKSTAERVARVLGKTVEELFDERPTESAPATGRRVASAQPALPFDTSPKPAVVDGAAESAEQVA